MTKIMGPSFGKKIHHIQWSLSSTREQPPSNNHHPVMVTK